MSIRLLACAIALALSAGAAHAEIYTWVDASGVRHYSDMPKSDRAEPAHLPGIQSVPGNPDALKQLRANAADQDSGQGAPASRLPELIEPQPQATIRDAQGVVPVAVAIGGAQDLRTGEQLTYYLDGSPIPQSPTTSTRVELGNVRRGQHTISVALRYRGRELRRSQARTFYVKPPDAISPLSTDAGADNDNSVLNGTAIAPPAEHAAGVNAAPRLGGAGAGAVLQ